MLILVFLFQSGCVVTSGSTSQELSDALHLVDQGVALLREEKIDQAEAAFRVAYALARIPQAVDGLGCVAFRRGEFITAEGLFQQAFEMDSRYSEALANLALLHDLHGDKEVARTLYQRVVDYDPQSARTRNNFAALLFEHSEKGAARLELLMANANAEHKLIHQNLKKMDLEKVIH